MLGRNKAMFVAMIAAQSGAAPAPVVPWYLAGGVAAANCIGAFKAIGVASQAASIVNLASPGTGNLTSPTPPTWDATGWAFNGSQGYLFPVAIPAGSSGILRFSDKVAGDTSYFGVLDYGNNLFWLCANGYSGSRRTYTNTEFTITATITEATAGVIAMTDYGYFDGVQETTQMNGLGSGPGGAGIGGTAYINGVLEKNFVGKIQAASFYNIQLTPEQVLAISTEMANLA